MVINLTVAHVLRWTNTNKGCSATQNTITGSPLIITILLSSDLRIIIEKSVRIGALHHLDENGRKFSFEIQKALGEGGRRHLDSPFVRSVNLEIVSKGGLKPQEAETQVGVFAPIAPALSRFPRRRRRKSAPIRVRRDGLDGGVGSVFAAGRVVGRWSFVDQTRRHRRRRRSATERLGERSSTFDLLRFALLMIMRGWRRRILLVALEEGRSVDLDGGRGFVLDVVVVVVIVEAPSTVVLFLISVVLVRFRIPVLTAVTRVGIELSKSFSKFLRLWDEKWILRFA